MKRISLGIRSRDWSYTIPGTETQVLHFRSNLNYIEFLEQLRYKFKVQKLPRNIDYMPLSSSGEPLLLTEEKGAADFNDAIPKGESESEKLRGSIAQELSKKIAEAVKYDIGEAVHNALLEESNLSGATAIEATLIIGGKIIPVEGYLNAQNNYVLWERKDSEKLSA